MDAPCYVCDKSTSGLYDNEQSYHVCSIECEREWRYSHILVYSQKDVDRIVEEETNSPKGKP